MSPADINPVQLADVERAEASRPVAPSKTAAVPEKKKGKK